ncbi:histidine kinase [Aureimonas altamirensis]|uniref:histidine kinase n=1 Tax=Aureimonas altamirensis TaxID=370622 RepID=UPI002036D035|nr:histidine kinase [Aureimonas altamirensis]MCM2502541.1 histidine kinase [Aureimonas altamirensis]
MPTLVRLLSALIVIAALVIASMALLVLYVEPNQREVTQTVPLRSLGQGAQTGAEQVERPAPAQP